MSHKSRQDNLYGESVFYFDPQKENSLVSVLSDLLNNEDLKRSKVISAKQWIEQYDWSITAEKHIRLINDAYAKKLIHGL